MSGFKPLNSNERGVVWQQFSKVSKQGSYYIIKCYLCRNEDAFIQVRLKTLRYHLWNNHQDFYVENFGDEPQLSTSTSSVSTLYSWAAAKPETTKKKSMLESWAERPMTKKEIEVFESTLIEMVVDCNMPFAWIERKSAKRFLAACRPTIWKHLSSRRRLSGSNLRKAATASVDVILPKVILLLTLRISAK